jgi:hypothetical protein
MIDILIEPRATANEPAGVELTIGLHFGLSIGMASFNHPRFRD